MKSKEEVEELIKKAFEETVTRTGFLKRVLNILDDAYNLPPIAMPPSENIQLTEPDIRN